MKESTENQMEIIDFQFETVKLALELLYDRQIPTLTMNEKMNILQFFDKYAVMDLKVRDSDSGKYQIYQLFRIQWKHHWLKKFPTKPSVKLQNIQVSSILQISKNGVKTS